MTSLNGLKMGSRHLVVNHFPNQQHHYVLLGLMLYL